MKRGAKGKEVARAVADAAGHFELKNLHPGKYTLVPLAPDANAKLPRAAQKEVSLKQGVNLTVDVLR